MDLQEAWLEAAVLDSNPRLSAEVVRILPGDIDPPRPEDNGWDVLVTVHTTDCNRCGTELTDSPRCPVCGSCPDCG